MKKYVKPTMNGEMFVANEYVGACWIVNCNGPRMIDPKLYSETNGVAGLQTTANENTPADTLVRSYNGSVGGCGTPHKGIIRDTEPVKNGYWTGKVRDGGTLFNPTYKTETYEVFWWNAAAAGYDSYHESLLGTGDLATNPNAS